MNERNPARAAETAPAEEPADDREQRVGQLLSFAEPVAPREIELASGRRVTVEEDEQDRLTVRGPEGEVELRVRFTATGPVLTFAAAAIDLKTPGRLDLECGRLRVQSRHGVEIEAGGDLVQNIEGDHVLRAGGGSQVEAHSVEIRSRAGDVRLHANDDARIEGERVLLNS
jgi:hypothetical protein